MILVILAGGLGTRFGGNKQTSQIDEYGNFLMDYSIYDAIKAGFNKVVVITNEQCNNEIKSKYQKIIGDKIKFETIVQDNSCKEYINGFSRQKPMGTAYALLYAKHLLDDDFCTVNADDFYGFDAFKVAINYKTMINSNANCAVIGYKMVETLSDNGAVNRGICKIDNQNIVKNLQESVIQKNGDKILANDLITNEIVNVDSDTYVSTSLFCFNKKIINFLEQNFRLFIQNEQNLMSNEFLLSTEINKLILQGKISMQMLKTSAQWLGMTYLSDKKLVENKIKTLKNMGCYPENLWNI